MSKLFISYRREDSIDIAGRIYDQLERAYSREAVYMDVDAIPIGVDFREHLADAVSQCAVLLAIIGPGWQNACFADGPKKGARRLDDPEDYVRIEIESALARGIPVVPVLIGDAAMPNETDLPVSLAKLPYINAAQVASGPDFRNHINRLVHGLEEHLSPSPRDNPEPLPASSPAIAQPPIKPPNPTLTPWSELEDKERQSIQRVLTYLEHGDFSRLNMAVRGLTSNGKSAALVRHVRAFCRATVNLKLDITADNRAEIQRGVATSLGELSDDPGLYETYARILRPMVLAFVKILCSVARQPEVKREILEGASRLAMQHGDNTLIRSLDEYK